MTSMWEPMTPNADGPAEEIAAADPGAGAPPPAPGFGVGSEDPDRAPETDRPEGTGAGTPDTSGVDTVFRTPDPADVSRDPAG